MLFFGSAKTRRTIGSKNSSGSARMSRIEGGVVVQLDEARRALEVRMAAELLAHVPIDADVLEEVVALEDAVLLHHPVVRLGHEGLEDRGGDLRVIPRPQQVADVVQQRAHDVLLVLARLVCASVALSSRVLQPVDGVAAAFVFAQQPELREHAVRAAWPRMACDGR